MYATAWPPGDRGSRPQSGRCRVDDDYLEQRDTFGTLDRDSRERRHRGVLRARKLSDRIRAATDAMGVGGPVYLKER
jgi:hypothetical protein